MADEGEKVGMAAAVALAISRAGAPLYLPEAMQLPLLPPVEDGEGAAAGDGKRGRGRPPGARSKRTEEIVAYLERRYPSPLEALAGVYSRNIKVLAAEFGLSAPTFDQLVELLRLQIVAANALAPYMHQKQPVAVQVASSGVVSLVINRGAGEGDQPGPRRPVIDVLPDPPPPLVDQEKEAESNG